MRRRLHGFGYIGSCNRTTMVVGSNSMVMEEDNYHFVYINSETYVYRYQSSLVANMLQ